MSRPIRVLELRSVRGTGGGPEKTILLGAARTDPSRAQVTVCYIRDLRDSVFALDRRAAALGIDYVEIPERHSFDPRVWPALRDIIRRRGIDVVHAHDYKTDLLALMVSAVERVRPIATAHGWSGVGMKERCYYAADRRVLACYPKVLAVSERIREAIIRAGGRAARVLTLPNGINAAAFRRDADGRSRMRHALQLPAGAVVIGTVGRLESVKRHDVLLEAAAHTPGRPWVVIAGDGPERGAIEARARALGMTGRLRLLGHRADAAEVQQAFDVYVQSSDSEGAPNAVLEAMAMEVPIVATDVGGTRDLLRDGEDGLLVPRRDPAALARSIAATLADGAAAAARVRSARARVERDLSFDARVSRLTSIYEEVVHA
jgi:glycosyltransferase involved in cell wall biosynthesis